MSRENQSRATVHRRQQRRRRIFWGIALVVAIYLLTPLMIGDMGLVKYFKMRNTYHELQRETRRLSEENGKIEAEIRALRSDPDTVERLARERLGLVRPGEVVYQFEPERP